MERKILHKTMDSDEFLRGYYLLEELYVFCRQEAIPIGGGKEELRKRIAHYLNTGQILKPKKQPQRICSTCSLETTIEENMRFSESLRVFFKQQIDSSFKFSVPFQHWLKTNVGKTYADAIVAYKQLRHTKEPTVIDKQFEYNTYIRDFFKYNKGKSLNDAILCWNYKKQKLIPHIYEPMDLQALKK